MGKEAKEARKEACWDATRRWGGRGKGVGEKEEKEEKEKDVGEEEAKEEEEERWRQSEARMEWETCGKEGGMRQAASLRKERREEGWVGGKQSTRVRREWSGRLVGKREG